MDLSLLIILLLVVIFIWIANRKSCSHEGYLSPIYLNREKIWSDWYPRSLYTIYGPWSTIETGHSKYKAY